MIYCNEHKIEIKGDIQSTITDIASVISVFANNLTESGQSKERITNILNALIKIIEDVIKPEFLPDDAAKIIEE